MNENELRVNISSNITTLRKRAGMTQAELAEKLCYSDKSISKWERGDGLPDVFVLVQMAELFGVSVNDLVCSAAVKIPAPQKNITRTRHILVTALSTGLVWFVATLAFFFLSIFLPDVGWRWMTFIYAIPVSAIVVVIFAHIWWGTVLRALSVSLLVWGVTVCIHLTALVPNVKNMTLIYAAAAVFQVLVILWYVYRTLKYKNAQKQELTQPVPENDTSESDETEQASGEINNKQ